MDENNPIVEEIVFVPLTKKKGYNLFLNGEIFAQFEQLNPYRKFQNKRFFSIRPMVDEKPLIDIGDEIVYGKLRMYPRELTAFYEDKPIYFSQREYKMVSLMAYKKGEVASVEELMMYAYQSFKVNIDTFRSVIKDIRRKFEKADANHSINCIAKVGYQLRRTQFL